MTYDRDSLAQPHNNLMLAILEEPSRALSILRLGLAPWIVEQLADEPPQPQDGSFVDQHLRATHSDKLFKVRFRDDQEHFVYVLFEHKSYSDPATALQVAKYKTRIWERYAQGRPERLRALPAILPLVVYHGQQPWTAPPSLAAMLAAKDQRLRELEAPFGYFLWDLGSVPLERLAGDPAARSGLLALRYSHARSEQERLALLELVLEGLPEDTEYGKQVVLYMIVMWELPLPTLEAAAERAKPGRGRRIVGEVAQQLVDQGRAEGRAEGKVEALAEAVMELAEHHFGQLPETIRRIIAAGSLTQLKAWHRAMYSGQPLSAVFGDAASE